MRAPIRFTIASRQVQREYKGDPVEAFSATASIQDPRR